MIEALSTAAASDPNSALSLPVFAAGKRLCSNPVRKGYARQSAEMPNLEEPPYSVFALYRYVSDAGYTENGSTRSSPTLGEPHGHSISITRTRICAHHASDATRTLCVVRRTRSSFQL
jgi:hypothetical protein